MCLLPERRQPALKLQSKELAPQTAHRLNMLELGEKKTKKNNKQKNVLFSGCLSFNPYVISDQGIQQDHSRVKFGENI